MSHHKCGICHKDPFIFFVWSSSRNFPREKAIAVFKIKGRDNLSELNKGYPVCYECLHKIKDD